MAEGAREPRRPNVLEVDASIAEAIARREGDWVTVGGIVGSATAVSTASGSRMAVVTLADFHASIEVIVSGQVLASFDPRVDDVILVGGRVSRRGHRTVLKAQLVERFELQLDDDSNGP